MMLAWYTVHYFGIDRDRRTKYTYAVRHVTRHYSDSFNTLPVTMHDDSARTWVGWSGL